VTKGFARITGWLEWGTEVRGFPPKRQKASLGWGTQILFLVWDFWIPLWLSRAV
jgi:hypothetical protein